MNVEKSSISYKNSFSVDIQGRGSPVPPLPVPPDHPVAVVVVGLIVHPVRVVQPVDPLLVEMEGGRLVPADRVDGEHLVAGL